MRKTTALLPASLALLPLLAAAQATAPTPPNEQVVIPQVERREVVVPKFPSKDFEIGAFVGTYGTQSFGASTVAGVRLGYHITEDFFVESAFGFSKVTDRTFEDIFPGQGPLTDADRKTVEPMCKAPLCERVRPST